MRLSDGTILMHDAAPYDPVKAHEYYLRTRELKGRRKAQSVISKPQVRKNNMPSVKSPTYTVNLGQGKTVKLTQRQLAEQQAYAAKRVNDIKTRLAELGTRLKKLMASAGSKKPLTAAEKQKAARQSKQYRQTHRQELKTKAKAAKTKTSATQRDSVAGLKVKINQVKGNLQAAVAAQRALASATKDGG
jgi:multidrug efflux pump subunit AcrB